MNDQERIARLEEWRNMHTISAGKLEKDNDTDHKLILSRLDDLEMSLVTYRRVVYAVGTTTGMICGAIIHYWDFIVNKIGH